MSSKSATTTRSELPGQTPVARRDGLRERSLRSLGKCDSALRKIGATESVTTMAPPWWKQYESRYRERPETLVAYADVWRRFPAMRDDFSGPVAFSQAANGERAQDGQSI